MTTPENLTVAERIRSKFDDLTRAERQLANTILENYPVSGLGSITSLAEASDVSTPTVVRMAKKLGFRGFPDIQTALRAEVEETISNPISKHNRWAGNAPDTHILNRFADSVMENMQQTLRQIDPAEFNAVAKLLSDKNRKVHIIGGRITHALADYLYTHMQMVRDGLMLIAASANIWPHYVLNMKPDDVLVIFDIRRYERDIQHLAETAKAKGATIIVFTDQWGSPVSKHATYSFHSRIEVPSAWDSSVVLMFIVEALIAAVQDLSWEETEDRMKSLEDLLDQTRMFRKFK